MKVVNLFKERSIVDVFYDGIKSGDPSEMLSRIDEVGALLKGEPDDVLEAYLTWGALKEGKVRFMEALILASIDHGFSEKLVDVIGCWELCHQRNVPLMRAYLRIADEDGLIDVVGTSAMEELDGDVVGPAIEQMRERFTAAERGFIIEALLNKMYDELWVGRYGPVVTCMLDAFNDTDHYDDLVMVEKSAAQFLHAYFSTKEKKRLEVCVDQASTPARAKGRL